MASKKRKLVAKKTTPTVDMVSSKKADNSLMMLLIAVALIATSYILFIKFTPKMPVQMNENRNVQMSSDEHIVQLIEQNNSGEYGNVTMMESNGKTVVKVSVKNAPKGVSQPAHIHSGSCIDMGDVVYPLKNLVNGMSETTLDVKLSDLQTKGPLSINVHQSASQMNKYVSCGNVTF